MVRGIPNLKKLDLAVCRQCQIGKMAKSSFKSKNYPIEEVLELFYTDLCGEMRTKISSGERYYILFVDDHSRIMTVMFLKNK